MRIPFAMGPSYTPQSIIADSQRTMNFYPEKSEKPGGKTQISLYPIPGLGAAVTSFDESPGRAIGEAQGRCFTVQGQTLYELDSSFVKTSRGTVARDGNPATLSDNGDGGDELFITSGDEGYILDLLTNTLTSEVSNVTMGDHLDGFFLALDADSSTLKISDALDGKTWDGTQFVQRSDASDPWKAMISQGGEIWLIGTKTGGVFYNAGTSPFPFALRTESFFERGVLAGFSLTRFDNSVAWLGVSEQGLGVVYRASGYSPVRISDHAVEEAINGYATVTDAIAWSYEDRGHAFYVLDFPTEGKTWAYDANTKMWHERGKWDTITGLFKGYRARHHALVFNKHLVTDGVQGGVYQMQKDTLTDAGGDVMRRERRMSHISNEHKQITVDEVVIELERGVGLSTGQGSDPLLMFRFSRDGGQTWSNERTVSAGKIGAYTARAIFRRLGTGRDWVFEIATSDPVPWRLVNGYFEAREGLH